MKLEITVAQSTQSAVPELNKKETTLNYLIIGEGDNKVIINVGEKTYKSVKMLIDGNMDTATAGKPKK